MRRALLFLFAIALLAGGTYVLAICLIHPSLYGLYRGAFGSLFLVALGGFILWDDFLKPYVTNQQT